MYNRYYLTVLAAVLLFSACAAVPDSANGVTRADMDSKFKDIQVSLWNKVPQGLSPFAPSRQLVFNGFRIGPSGYVEYLKFYANPGMVPVVIRYNDAMVPHEMTKKEMEELDAEPYLVRISGRAFMHTPPGGMPSKTLKYSSLNPAGVCNPSQIVLGKLADAMSIYKMKPEFSYGVAVKAQKMNGLALVGKFAHGTSTTEKMFEKGVLEKIKKQVASGVISIPRNKMKRTVKFYPPDEDAGIISEGMDGVIYIPRKYEGHSRAMRLRGSYRGMNRSARNRDVRRLRKKANERNRDNKAEWERLKKIAEAEDKAEASFKALQSGKDATGVQELIEPLADAALKNGWIMCGIVPPKN